MNNQVLVLAQQTFFTKFIGEYFKELSGIKPIQKESCEELEMFLELLGEVDLLIIEAKNYADEIHKLLLFLLRKGIQIKNILVIGEVKKQHKNQCRYVSEDPMEIIRALDEILRVPDLISSVYMSIPVDSLVHFAFMPFDLFIKLSDNNFVKRFRACDSIDKDTLQCLKLRGVTELYFDKSYNREFSMLLLNNMTNKVDREYASLEEKLKASDEVFLTTKEIVQSMGFPSRIIRVCETVIESIQEDVQFGKNQFSAYLAQLKKQEYSFHYRFIELTSFFATQMVDELEVFSSSNYAKLVIFSALFCDVSLKEPSFIHIQNTEQLDRLTEVQYIDVKNHALKSSEMVMAYSNAPNGADRIIKHHHGSLNGCGFSDKSFESICPLSKCLIISHALAYEILSQPDVHIKLSMNKVIDKFRGSPIQDIALRFESRCKIS